MTEAATHLTEIQPHVTPSGIEVYYQPDPRLYRVNGVEVPSVTTVLDILHKPALTWWGMKIGVEGVLTLRQMEHDAHFSENGNWKDFWPDTGARWPTADEVVEYLTSHKLTVNHVRDKAASRGSSVHDAFETWCRTGHKPDARDYPPQESGYVQGLLKFIAEVNPEPIETELMVGSARHGYAGRLDLLAFTESGIEVQTGPRTKRKIPNGTAIIDLKTSKGCYPSHRLQLAAYAEAILECGYGRTAYEAVVLVRDNGTFDFVVSEARFSQFLDVRRCYEALKGLK